MRWIPLIALSLLLFGCQTVNRRLDRRESHSLDTPESTRLGHLYEEAQKKHPGLTGFRILAYGAEALLARAALVDSAERTLDLQYYIFDPDKVGHTLTQRIIDAADRGRARKAAAR